MARIVSECPCCGGRLFDVELKWDMESRTLVRGKRAIVFSRNHARFFNALWRARKRGGALDHAAIMDAVYGDDPGGGPDGSNVISVMASSLRKILKPLGLGISSNNGPYPLYRLTGR